MKKKKNNFMDFIPLSELFENFKGGEMDAGSKIGIEVLSRILDCELIPKSMKKGSNKKRTKRTQKTERDLFRKIILSLQKASNDSFIMKKELSIDLSKHDALFWNVIFEMIKSFYGKNVYEVLKWYLLDKFKDETNPEFLYDENDNIIPTDNVEDILNIIVDLLNEENE